MEKRPLQTSNAANITSKRCKHQNIALFKYLNSSSIEKRTVNRYVYENDMMVYRSLSYVPVLYKIFKRIIFDAADSIERSPSMDYLKVTINQDTVVVYTYGRGVPEWNHQEQKVSLATTLTENDFCTEFLIEIADGLRLKKFEQVFTNNITERKSEPKITKCQASDNWTKLTFKPNLEKFKMEHLEEDDVVGLMKKLVLDMAECLGKTVKVELNDRFVRIIESFEDYDHLCMKSRPVNPFELALSVEKAEDRNTWNHNFESGKELIVFSSADLKRSIPSVVDGLLPDQRKVLFCAFERKLYEEINVGQFIGYVSCRYSACHNGEKSLACTIIEMAQDFVGSNNISLLKPNRQCGTRDYGGEDHARFSCIYTELNPLTRYLFHEDDIELLHCLNESIELDWYIPIIPLVLVNGSRGIGAGWTSIPSYDPMEIIANVKRLLRREVMVPMDPHYRRFKGTIEKTAKKGEYRVSGCMKKLHGQTFEITELPIRMWTGDYLEFLESICGGSPNVKDPLIEDINFDMGDYANVNITIKIKSDKIASIDMLSQNELYEKFKLISTVSTNNMHLFDADGKIKKFDNPEQILKEFCPLRLHYYEKRKENIVSNLSQHILILENKARFLEMVLEGHISFMTMIKRSKLELISELKQKGFVPEQRKGKSAEPQVAGANDDNSKAREDGNSKEEGTWGGYEYLTSIPLCLFSLEYLDILLDEKMKKMWELGALKERSCSEMWMMDLVELEMKIHEINRKEEAEEERKRSSQASKTKTRQNVEPENDNISVAVENVVEVTKPKGRAGSKKTQKDSADDVTITTFLKRSLDEYCLSSSSSSGEDMETEVAATIKRRVIQRDSIWGMDLSSESESSESESSESESDQC